LCVKSPESEGARRSRQINFPLLGFQGIGDNNSRSPERRIWLPPQRAYPSQRPQLRSASARPNRFTSAHDRSPFTLVVRLAGALQCMSGGSSERESAPSPARTRYRANRSVRVVGTAADGGRASVRLADVAHRRRPGPQRRCSRIKPLQRVRSYRVEQRR
jgi:hypothetical protein